jgi:hypothetical protein
VRTALQDVVPNTELLGRLGVRYVAAEFPIADCGARTGDCRLESLGQFDGVYVYRNAEAQPVAELESGDGIAWSDGSVLYRYRPWPVVVGWAVSSGVMACLLVIWMFGRLQGRHVGN